MALFLWLAVTLWSGLPAQATSPPPAVELAVAVRLLHADGRQGPVAWTTLSDENPDGGWIAFVPGGRLGPESCGAASGEDRSTMPTSAGAVVWFVSGAILHQAPDPHGDQFTIEVAVPRADGTHAARQRLVVRRGERIELDHVTSPLDGCSTVVVDASVEPHTAPGTPPRLQEASLDARAALQAVAASGSPVPATLALLASEPPSGGPTERSHWADGTPVVLQAFDAGAYDADLWLVHTSPSGAQTAVHVSGSLDLAGQAFSFPIETLPTAAGPMTVDVAANLRAMETADHQVVLRASIGRVVQRVSRATPAPHEFVRSYGTMGQAILMPAADAVVSFELPPPGPADPTSGHRFDLRVRITPHRSERPDER